MRFSLLLFGLLGAFCPYSRAQLSTEVRVRLQAQLEKVEIQGLGLEIGGETKEEALRVALPSRQNYKIRKFINAKGSFWQIENLATHQTHLDAHSLLGIRGQQITVNSVPVPEKIILYARDPESTDLDVVGFIPLEDYISGVVAKEMPLHWPLEALKAQAIAARSYTLAVMQERRNHLVQLESSVLDQVFVHRTQMELESLQNKNVNQAVLETKGMVLQSHRGQPLKAFYHSECGGRTLSSAQVFGVQGLRGGVVDPSCPLRKSSHWRFELPKSQLEAYLGVYGLSPRAMQKFLEAYNPQKLREKLGYSSLKSTSYQISKRDTSWVFEGQGSGHGVGLCQWGSKALAEKGQNYISILAHYYPEAKLFSELNSGEARKNLQSKKTDSYQDQQMFN
jgi:stage II sporulation protein D